MPNHRVGDASHESSPNPTQTPAAYHYQAGFYLLGQADDLLGHGDSSFIRPSKPEVALRHAAPFGLDPLDLIIQPLQDYLPCFLLTGYAGCRRLGGRIIASSPWECEPGMHDVQLGVGTIGHIDGGGCSKLCILRAVGG